MKRAEVLPDGKVFKIMLGSHELGISKTDSDARFHMYAINDAIDVAYLEGQKYLERLVAKQHQDLALEEAICKAKAIQTSGPQCKKCGAFTTKTRVESHGLCMKCEGEKGSQSLA